jgi:hypothetical protein
VTNLCKCLKISRTHHQQPPQTDRLALLGAFDFDPDGGKARARRCFTLKFKEGWTLDQIAEELYMNRITVHKTLRGKIRPYIYFEYFGQWPDGKISDHYLSDEEGKEILNQVSRTRTFFP